MTPAPLLPLPPVDLADAPPHVRELLQRGKRAAGGMLPNMYRQMAHAPAMFETYLQGYERFRIDSGFSPVEQEVVFLTISVENACEYCMAAHSLLADVRVGVPREVTEAIRSGSSIPDARLAELAGFTRDLLLSRGRPEPAAIGRFLAAGYTHAQVLELVHAIALKTLSNYANHLMDTPLDAVFTTREWRVVQLGSRAVQILRRTFDR